MLCTVLRNNLSVRREPASAELEPAGESDIICHEAQRAQAQLRSTALRCKTIDETGAGRPDKMRVKNRLERAGVTTAGDDCAIFKFTQTRRSIRKSSIMAQIVTYVPHQNCMLTGPGNIHSFPGLYYAYASPRQCARAHAYADECYH